MDDMKKMPPMPGMPPMGGPGGPGGMPPMGGPGGPGGMPPMGGPGGPGGPPMREPIVLPEKDWDNMTLNWDQYTWKKSENGTYYEVRFVYFVTNVESKEHQYMNIFVPAAYLNEDGTVNEAGACGDYTARTAPIVFQNECAGWKSSTPDGVNEKYIENGFVYIHTGARSRDLPLVGKAPAACVDQKAGIRFLRLHDDKIPGDKEKIISCGSSGGGQMSSILGATGNMPVYYPYLYEMGAAGIEKDAQGNYISTIPDHIYGSQCYCPIADLNNADMAYAWMRYDDPELTVSEMFGPPTVLSPFKQALQQDLAQAYCAYINSLGMKNAKGETLTFPKKEDGTFDPRGGSFYAQVLENISASLNAWIREMLQADGSVKYSRNINPFTREECTCPSLDAYFASFQDVDQWLKKNEDGTYSVTDLAGFCRGTELKRGKDVPGFDTFHFTAENDAFGKKEEAAVHFSASVAAVLEANYDRYKTLPGFDACDVDAYIAQGKRQDLIDQSYLMNATHILLGNAKGTEKSDFSRFWRTRNGTADEHTGFTIAYNLAMAAKMAGAEVDYSLVWAAPHGDVDGDGTGSFVEWIHQIAK